MAYADARLKAIRDLADVIIADSHANTDEMGASPERVAYWGFRLATHVSGLDMHLTHGRDRKLPEAWEQASEPLA